ANIITGIGFIGAGAIFKDNNGNLIRPAQCCTPRYGNSIQLFKIDTLSKTDYTETFLSEMLPNWEKSIKGTHTFNYSDGLFCGDIQVKRSKFI
ncbi:MAG: MgtC/SapB family protein, partial [Bacteroidota bacterium]